MTKTTPTGVEVKLCGLCGREHAVTQKHCTACGRSSLFIHPDNDHCLRCGWPDA